MRDIKVYTALFDGGLHNGQLTWTPYIQPGRSAVDVEWLYTGEQTGSTGAEAYIANFRPGSHGNLHEHLGYELLLILEGELHNDNGDRYLAGTLFVEKPHSIHQVSSPAGCIALVVREKGTRPVATDTTSDTKGLPRRPGADSSLTVTGSETPLRPIGPGPVVPRLPTR